jgi:HlyD family secretion protein
MAAYRDEVFGGTLESVSPAIADVSRGAMSSGVMNYFEAKIRLKTDGRRIYSGLTADADIETSRHDGIKVPSQAVLGRALDTLPDEIRNSPAVQKDRSVASVVYRIVDGKAVATPVVVGASDETHTLITTGLDEGAEVIVGPYKVLDTLAHDQKVKKSAAAATTQPATQPATQATTVPSTGPS